MSGLLEIKKGLEAMLEVEDINVHTIEFKETSIYFHLVEPSKTFKITRKTELGKGWVVDIASQGPVGCQIILTHEGDRS